MNDSIFLPDKIRVGYQKREDTYTGQLAYVIYYDEKGKIRKEKSWDGWRDHEIDPTELTNEPTSGFVLNKKVGGDSNGWDHRQTYVRVFDPRGFEFEIDVPNLLYILANTSSIIGKGLEGDFVYGWEGSNLVLIPTGSPDYKKLENYNNNRKSTKKIKGAELVVGGTYQTRSNTELIYMGRFECFEEYSWNSKTPLGTSKGLKYFFCQMHEADGHSKAYEEFEAINSVGTKIIAAINETPVANYADLMVKLSNLTMFSPYDKSKDENIPLTVSDMIIDLTSENGHSNNTSWNYGWSRSNVYAFYDSVHVIRKANEKPRVGWNAKVEYYPEGTYYITQGTYGGGTPQGNDFVGTMEEIVAKYKPYIKKMYLANGNHYKTGVES